MKIKTGVTLVALMMLFMTGCVSAGKDFDSALVKQIVSKKTTKSEVQRLFGYPYMTGVDNGFESWNYHFTKASASSAQSKDLYMTFDSEGVVRSYSFSTSFPEEMSLPK